MNLQTRYSSAVFFLCLFTFHPSDLRAQQSDLRFDHLSLEQGLSQSTVNTIVQDGLGFMWFGTQDGLNRYDGYDIAVFKNSSTDSNSIADNGIWALCRDRTGDLWIGTMRGGLNRHGAQQNVFFRFLHDPSDPRSISENNVTSVFQDSRGRIWAGTLGSGLNLLAGPEGGFFKFKHDPSDSTSLSDNAVWSICEDTEGVLWVATWGGLNRFVPTSDTSGSFVRFRHNPRDPFSLASNNVRTLLVDRQGSIWVGTWGAGLDRFDKSTSAFTHVTASPAHSGTLSSNQILSLFEDSKGTLWVGTGDAGLNRYDRLTQRFTRYRHDANNLRTLNNNIICSIFEDAAGGLWIGTGAGGVNRFDWLKNRFAHYRDNPADPSDLNGNDVWALLEDRMGDLWIGTYGSGLNRLDRKTGRFTWYRHDAANPSSLSHDNVISLCESKTGDLWIGTEGGGLNRFERTTGRFIHYLHNAMDPTSLVQNEITSLLEDRFGFLWIGTNGGGLDRYDVLQGEFVHYRPDPSNNRSLSASSIMTIYEDRSGAIWVGTWGGGISRYDRRTDSFERFLSRPTQGNGLSNNTVLSLYQDEQGILWAGTQGGGLSGLELASGRWIGITEADGLPNNVVYGILPDPHGYLWLTTNKGLCRFDPKTRLSKNYDANDGLQGNEFNQGSYCRGRAGELFIGGINGFNVFVPDSIRDNPIVPPVYITQFRIFDRPVPLSRAISALKNIQLSYAQNFFSCEFVALNYSSPEKNLYAYMLEGLDEQWIESGVRRYVSYTNLDPGHYTLRIRGSNNDGKWNETGIALDITITPPIWKRWWFRALGVLAIVGLLFLAYRVRVNRLLAIERVRSSIATDLHDDIGSTLTEIALFSDVGLRQLQTLEKQRAAGDGELRRVETVLQDIGSTSRSLIDAMNDIVWSIDPKNDSFEFLLLRMKTHAARILEARGINYEIDIPPELSGLKLPLGFRRRFYLIFKEAINNVIRHARPMKVTLTIRQENGSLIMIIADDGTGFDPGAPGHGNGLHNMKERALWLKGDIAISSAVGVGTTITLRAPIPRKSDRRADKHV